MIILDTCVIRGMRLDGSEVEVLRAIVATGTERVGAPSMAVEELAAQKALEYVEAHRAAARALRQLANKSHRTEPKLEEPDPEGVREMWRKKYSFLDVLPTSGEAAMEGLYREANVLPPATTKGEGDKRVKVGARDVAIWLTAVEYAREHPDETVYFVSNNHRDFTKGDAYPPPMDADVADLGDRFVHLTNLDELLETVAPRVPVSEADALGLLTFHTEYVALTAQSVWSRGTAPIHVRTREGEAITAQTWAFPAEVRVQLTDVSDVEAYQLGAKSWIVATARWQLVGLAIGTTLVQAACTWETRILFPGRSGDDHRPRIISSSRAVPVEDASAVDWPPMQSSAESVQRVMQIAAAEGRKPTWIEVLLGALIAWPNLLQQSSDVDLSTYPPYQPIQLKQYPPLGACLPEPVEDQPEDEQTDEE
ncbi:PIN domain-containing protein [Streptomyces sp. NPDC051907]|uniref:PIN domain-containing protein n=1 Tax=Streptomyces sp. NPDC051907 TaxID=3155284 RepID=UPI00341F1FC2